MIVSTKAMNFSDDKFSIYSNNPSFKPEDLASTLSAIMDIEIPRMNEGSFIEELLLIDNKSVEANKLSYFGLKVQSETLQLKYLDSKLIFNFLVLGVDINEIPATNQRLFDENEPLEAYYNQFKKMNIIYNESVKQIRKKEAGSNRFISFFICLVSLMIILTIYQQLTFANIFDIVRVTKIHNMDIQAFFTSLVVQLAYYLVFYFFSLSFLDFDYRLQKSENASVIKEVSFLFLYPIIFLFIVNRLLNVFWIGATEVQNINTKEIISFTSLNIVKPTSRMIFKNEGLGHLYLYRIYNILLNLIISLILFYSVNSKTFYFSNSPTDSYFTLLDSSSLRYLRICCVFLCLVIVNLIYNLINLGNFPKFDENKQIFDSIFVLYDDKLISSNENVTETPEKDALNSKLGQCYLNFDYQSEYFYLIHSDEINLPKINEVFFNKKGIC